MMKKSLRYNYLASPINAILVALMITMIILNIDPVVISSQKDSLNIVSTIYAGYIAIDRYRYNDVFIDVIYLNPRIYYSYRNAYVVYHTQNYVPYDQPLDPGFYSMMKRVVEELNSLGIHTDLVTRYVATVVAKDSNQHMTIKGLINDTKASYMIESSSGRSVVNKIDLSKYIVIENRSRTYLVMSYTGLSDNEKKRVIEIIGETFKGLNTSVMIYDSKAFEIENAYYDDLYIFDNNNNLKNMLTDAIIKAVDMFKKNNYSCFSFAGGLMGGYWLTLGITGTYNDCSREVINFVRTYVDEIRKIVPDDKPIYIELQEKAEKIVLLTEPANKSYTIITMTILMVLAVSILSILMWRSIRKTRAT
jgi:hypothetical protein